MLDLVAYSLLIFKEGPENVNRAKIVDRILASQAMTPSSGDARNSGETMSIPAN